jgi:fibronectin-binding autotransporter adhesin
VLSNDLNVDVLLVAGGGGGGQDNAGGGGAGGLIFKPDHGLQVGGYTVIIGSGGSGSPHQNIGPEAKVGGNTEIKGLINGSGLLVAYGGGAGMNGGTERAAERNGGSGGGGASETDSPTGGGTATQTGTYNYGNNGGNGVTDAGGGGGGAGAVGQNGSVDGAGYGGTGGDGLNGVTDYDFAEIFGTRYGELIGEDVWFAGGGAGANINYSVNNTVGGSFRPGGKGGGGGGPIAGTMYVEVKSGLPNTGGGGCGATWFDSGLQRPTLYDLHGGDGGSGIVIIRYKL